MKKVNMIGLSYAIPFIICFIRNDTLMERELLIIAWSLLMIACLFADFIDKWSEKK